MKLSQLFSPTLREDPADAEVISHKLLLRAGFIRRVTSGVYDFLPLGLRVLRKIEQIVREEMDASGAQELLMPMVQPAELWQDSGRWDKYGRELLRFTDRHDHDSCLGPTHEEVICDLVSRELRSYKQLPMNLYQIQAKFRDEIRPRFGLMRAREFIMKDAYSFHADETDLAREYQNMFEAYSRIFSRLGLKFRAVEADTGSIGGRASHEFHVLAESGEDVIAHCASCDYAANVEKAESTRVIPRGEESDLSGVDTPNVTSADDVAEFLHVDISQLVKTLVFRVQGGPDDEAIAAVCVRGDDQLQETKLIRALSADTVEMASDECIASAGGVTGFVGPIGLSCRTLFDHSLKDAVGLVSGANECDRHITGLDMGRDLPDAEFTDLREARSGDTCLKCGAEISLSRGIEVGHVFELGRVYAEPLQVEFQDEQGKRAVTTMGCYGIGISRLLAAIVEQCHDEMGIAWPAHLAPFHVALISIGNSAAVQNQSQQIYDDLTEAGFEVLWDERKERPGVKFRDAELMGLPVRLVVGDRGLANGELECQLRQGEKKNIALAEAVAKLEEMIPCR